MFPVLQQTRVIIWDEVPMQHMILMLLINVLETYLYHKRLLTCFVMGWNIDLKTSDKRCC